MVFEQREMECKRTATSLACCFTRSDVGSQHYNVKRALDGVVLRALVIRSADGLLTFSKIFCYVTLWSTKFLLLSPPSGRRPVINPTSYDIGFS